LTKVCRLSLLRCQPVKETAVVEVGTAMRISASFFLASPEAAFVAGLMAQEQEKRDLAVNLNTVPRLLDNKKANQR
jgi:hypothetical protein